MKKTIIISSPNDMHVHFRDNEILKLVVPETDKIYENLELAIHRIIKDKNNKFISSKLHQGDKPNGSFSSVSVCPKTKHILPPKSYHDFEKIVNIESINKGKSMTFGLS